MKWNKYLQDKKVKIKMISKLDILYAKDKHCRYNARPTKCTTIVQVDYTETLVCEQICSNILPIVPTDTYSSDPKHFFVRTLSIVRMSIFCLDVEMTYGSFPVMPLIPSFPYKN